MSGQIFISYRRDDSSAFAGRIYDRLISRFAEDQISFDVDNLDPGVDFVEAIEASIDSSDVFLVVIGRRWLASADEEGQRRLDNPDDYVRLEIAALKHIDVDKAENTRLTCGVRNVTKNGFDLVFRTWDLSSIGGARSVWIAWESRH